MKRTARLVMSSFTRGHASILPSPGPRTGEVKGELRLRWGGPFLGASRGRGGGEPLGQQRRQVVAREVAQLGNRREVERLDRLPRRPSLRRQAPPGRR